MTTSTATLLRSLLVRSDQALIKYFDGATNVCASRMHGEILAEHLLLRLLDDPSGAAGRIFDTFDVDVTALREDLQRVLNELPRVESGKPALSHGLLRSLENAGELADAMGSRHIGVGHLMLVFVSSPDRLLVSNQSNVLDQIDPKRLYENFDEILSTPSQTSATANVASVRDAESALARFTIDLTERASRGEIDPVFGRDREIRQMIDIFSRRRKNNPILVGEPGTGKTAIVEGLALRIVEGDVPPVLKDVRIVALDLGLLQAGASVKGEFENRLKNVIREIKESGESIIAFIDEAHMMIGAGAQAGGGDAANLLKPALARGQLRTVAATTWSEYKKYFEKDAALERRFQLVKCDEPSVENTVVMLRGLRDKYESHHNVIVLDEAISAAAELSHRYISGRFLPDKAVDLLDTAAGRVAVAMTTKPAPLDDIERDLGNTVSAISAFERDSLGGISVDPSEVESLEQKVSTLQGQRADLIERWEHQTALVEQIVEARANKLANGDSSSNNGDHAVAAESPRKIDGMLADLKSLQGEEPLVFPHVDASVIAAVVSDWTGIPAGRVLSDNARAVLNLEDGLRSRVIGQDHVLSVVAEQLRIARAGLGNPNQPMGVFLCVGPSGVGKTELALTVADLVFGGDGFLTTINMSEFMEKHTVAQLKGSPPGYVGYGEGGVLTEAVRRHPYSVVLLDEVEKAHPDVLNLFYQVFDKGMLADGEGRVVDFKNTVIILTSNLGTDAIQEMCASGEEIDIDMLREAIYPHLRGHFKPALVARMNVVPFFTLDDAVLQLVARMKLAKVGTRLEKEHRLEFKVVEQVYANLASKCQQVDLGARQIDHLLNRSVLPNIARKLLSSLAEDESITRFTLGVTDDGTLSYDVC